MRASGSKIQNKHVFLFICFIILPNRPSKHTERDSTLILLFGTTRQVCATDYQGRKSYDQVSDQVLGASKNVTNHVIGPPTV